MIAQERIAEALDRIADALDRIAYGQTVRCEFSTDGDNSARCDRPATVRRRIAGGCTWSLCDHHVGGSR